MDYFYPSKVHVPRCPSDGRLTEFFAYPLLAWIYMLLALVTLLFTVITGVKYNSVPVFIEYVML